MKVYLNNDFSKSIKVCTIEHCMWQKVKLAKRKYQLHTHKDFLLVKTIGDWNTLNNDTILLHFFAILIFY